MESYAYIVALIMGTVMLLSVCYVYIQHQVLQFGGIVMSFFAFLLVGMSVWKTINFAIDESGIQASLAQAIERAEAAQADAETARSAAELAKQEVVKVQMAATEATKLTTSLQAALDTIKVQDALRVKGYYDGPLDGVLTAKTAASLRQFQSRNNLSTTATINPETLQRLQVAPLTERTFRAY